MPKISKIANRSSKPPRSSTSLVRTNHKQQAQVNEFARQQTDLIAPKMRPLYTDGHHHHHWPERHRKSPPRSQMAIDKRQSMKLSSIIFIIIKCLLLLLLMLQSKQTRADSSHTAISSEAPPQSSQLRVISPSTHQAEAPQGPVASGDPQQQNHHQHHLKKHRRQSEAESPEVDLQGHPQAASARPRSRQPRIYRIRAAGSNGSFSHSALRVNLHPADIAPNGTSERTDGQHQFGVRNQQASAKLVLASTNSSSSSSSNKQQKCTSPAADGETAAETSSISASSQTLQLSAKAGPHSTAHQQQLQVVVQGDQSAEAIAHELPQTSVAESGPGLQQAPEESQQQSQQSEATSKQRQTSEQSILSLIDEFDSKITTNRTQAQLSCDSGEMVIRLNFTEPFKGIVYPDHNRLSPCRFFGDGHHNYELRLPLRGCGTRQVAPRVFVNDVVVRFHKTLELEEDEVKTLICRYPPPLETSAGNNNARNNAAGNGLVHELDSSPGGHSIRLPSYVAGENLANQKSTQFEFVDPTSGKPTSRFGSGGWAGQLAETYGELLAPSGGRHRQPPQSNLNLSPAERILLRQGNANTKSSSTTTTNNNNNHNNHDDNDTALLMPSSTGDGSIKQQNSRLFDPEATTTNNPAIGLIERGTGQRAPLGFFERLTSVELLFLISSLMFLVLLALGLAGSYYCYSGRHRSGGGGGGRKRRYFNSPTSMLASTDPQVASAAVPFTGPHYQGHLIAPSTLYSHSPTAAAAAATRSPALYYHQHYLQQHLPAKRTAPSSSPDNSDVSGQNLLPARSADSAAHLTGAGRSSYLASAGQHYQASTLMPIRRHQQFRPSVVVAGRRQAADGSGDGRPPAPLGGSATNFEPAATLGRRANRALASSREPLLRSADAHHHHNHHGRHHQHDHHQAPQQGPVRVLAPAVLESNQSFAQMRHSKSLQQLREDTDQHHHHRQLGADWQQRQPQQQQHHHQLRQNLNDSKIKLKQQQHHFDTSTLTRAQRLATGRGPSSSGSNAKQRAEFVGVFSSSSSDTEHSSLSSCASDSELELNNNANGNNQAHGAKLNAAAKPKLMLQSIEDSFVTNFTEIYEQEYEKRDTTRPLSVAEWQSRQPVVRLSAASGEAARAKSSLVSDDQAEREEEEEEPPADQSNQTNLRSLTELDVNFAKSLLRPTLKKGPAAREVVAKTPPMEGQGEIKVRTTSTRVADEPPEILNKLSDSHNEPAQKRPHTQGVTGSGRTSAASDDLVISPEYNVGRLKLEGGGGGGGGGDQANRRQLRQQQTSSPTSSHESISYV